MQEELSNTSDISLRDYLDVMRRRKAILIQTFVVVFVVGIVITFSTRPLYRASARVLVEDKPYNVSQLDPANPLSALFSAGAGHESETPLEVLQGEKVVAATYRSAGIAPGTVKLQVKPSGSTDILDVVTESNTPSFAQTFANALPGVYRHYITGNRRAEVARALKFAQARKQEETQALQQADRNLQRFQDQFHVSEVSTVRAHRLSAKMAAETEVQKVAGQVAGLQARLNWLLKTQQALPGYLETATTLTSPQLQLLQDQIAALETQRQGLLVLFKPSHTKVQELDAQITHLQARLAQTPAMTTTVQRIPNPALGPASEKIATARTELAEAQAQFANARQHVSSDAGGLDRHGLLERTQGRLERDIDKHEAALTLITKSVDDLSLRQKMTHNPIRVISPAGPAAQVAPRSMNNMAAAALIGLILGLCFALLQEFMDDRIHAPEEARAIFGVPVLGYIPMGKNGEARHLGRTSNGPLLETYRALGTNVMFSAAGVPIQSILVTSTMPGEGKSLTAFNLAVAMAMSGKRVILVDTDLRRPTLHKVCGLERRLGLTNVLVGELTLEEALQKTSVRNLRVLTAGTLPSNPAEILNSASMRKLHAALRERADMVLYDTPPCLATADAQALSVDVDGVLYVVQCGETKKSEMRRAAELLAQAHARVLGLVFNKIVISGKRDNPYFGYYRYYNHDQGDGFAEEDGTARHLSTSEFNLLLQQRLEADEAAHHEYTSTQSPRSESVPVGFAVVAQGKERNNT